jgi:hypothetical protein
MRDIFGALADDPIYVAEFSKALLSLSARGVRSTLGDYLSHHGVAA